MNPLKVARTHLFTVHRKNRCVPRGCFPCIYYFSVNLALKGDTREPTTSTEGRGFLPQSLSHLSPDPPVEEEEVPHTMLGPSSISYCLPGTHFLQSSADLLLLCAEQLAPQLLATRQNLNNPNLTILDYAILLLICGSY